MNWGGGSGGAFFDRFGFSGENRRLTTPRLPRRCARPTPEEPTGWPYGVRSVTRMSSVPPGVAYRYLFIPSRAGGRGGVRVGAGLYI